MISALIIAPPAAPATKQNNSWTPEADEQLRAMLLGGKSVLATSARLKRTMGAVRCRASILGLSVCNKRAVRDQRNTATKQKAAPPS
jgi:hypothetical protein